MSDTDSVISIPSDDPILGEMSALCEERCSIPRRNLFNDYMPGSLSRAKKDFHIERSYEAPYKTYFLVFQPLKAKYHKYFDNYQKDILRLEKTIRRRLKYKRILITREIHASQTHYNVVVTTDQDIAPLHQKAFNSKYGLYMQECPTRGDIETVIEYCFKENKTRAFRPCLDKYIYLKD